MKCGFCLNWRLLNRKSHGYKNWPHLRCLATLRKFSGLEYSRRSLRQSTTSPIVRYSKSCGQLKKPLPAYITQPLLQTQSKLFKRCSPHTPELSSLSSRPCKMFSSYSLEQLTWTPVFGSLWIFAIFLIFPHCEMKPRQPAVLDSLGWKARFCIRPRRLKLDLIPFYKHVRRTNQRLSCWRAKAARTM